MKKSLFFDDDDDDDHCCHRPDESVETFERKKEVAFHRLRKRCLLWLNDEILASKQSFSLRLFDLCNEIVVFCHTKLTHVKNKYSKRSVPISTIQISTKTDAIVVRMKIMVCSIFWIAFSNGCISNSLLPVE